MDPSNVTEQVLFEKYGVTRSDLSQGLADFGAPQAPEPPASKNDYHQQRPVLIEPAQTFYPGGGDIEDALPAPQPPIAGELSTPVVCTGILNGAAASVTVFTAGDLAPL